MLLNISIKWFELIIKIIYVPKPQIITCTLANALAVSYKIAKIPSKPHRTLLPPNFLNNKKYIEKSKGGGKSDGGNILFA